MEGSRPRELAAVPLVAFLLGTLFLVLAAAAVGPWAWVAAGILILTGVAYGVRSLKRSGTFAADDLPAVAERRDPGAYNVLVVADAPCPPEALRRVIEEHAAGRPVTAFVVAPTLSSRLDRITGDEAAYARANENLASTLDSLDGLVASRHGKLGSHDLLEAVAEALREFPAEEILVSAQSDRSLAAETRFGVHVAALTP
jgi:hypothetical protein